MQWCVTCDVREMNRSRLERKINKVEEIQNEQISRRIWICRIPSKLAICKRKNFFSIAQLIVFGRNTCSCSVNWSFLVHLQPAIVRNLGNIGYFVTRLGAERIWCWWYFLSMQMRSLDADMTRHDRKLKVGDWREIHLSVSILEVFDRSVQLWWREISTRSPQVMKTSCVFFLLVSFAAVQSWCQVYLFAIRSAKRCPWVYRSSSWFLSELQRVCPQPGQLFWSGSSCLFCLAEFCDFLALKTGTLNHKSFFTFFCWQDEMINQDSAPKIWRSFPTSHPSRTRTWGWFRNFDVEIEILQPDSVNVWQIDADIPSSDRRYWRDRVLQWHCDRRGKFRNDKTHGFSDGLWGL